MDKLRIAVCDDEIVQQKLIQALLQKYLTENNILAEVKFYTSGQEYLKEKRVKYWKRISFCWTFLCRR